MKIKAVLSGDVIAYTSLELKDRRKVDNALKKVLAGLKKKFGGFNRIIKGDYIEYYLDEPASALRVCLAVKSFLKSVEPEGKYDKKSRVKFFRMYGISLAAGIGTIERFDKEKGIIDGDAIYFSGRMINKTVTRPAGKSFIKEPFAVKETLFIMTHDASLTARLEPVFALLDFTLSRMTSRQSEVIYYKLLGYNEEETAGILNIEQPTVNQHSTSAGWNAIEKAVLNFEQINFQGI